MNRMLLTLIVCTIYPSLIFAEINSASITAATLKALPHCSHYRVRGVCYWADWKGINTTLYIEQYLPDLVVSVFNRAGDNPWTEMNATLDKAGSLTQQQLIKSFTGDSAGAGQHSFSNTEEQNVFFKEADVIGNPALMLLPKEGFLPSSASALKPYYQSMLDSILWRGIPLAHEFPPEEIYALMADLKHHVGTGLINWGGIYPHEGKLATSNDAKAAAVIAQRAADLVNSSEITHLTGHIYQQLTNRCGQECSASPIQENSDKTLFQMIYPTEESSCDYFGKTLRYGEESETKAQGNYVWIVWRFYSGCADGNGKFIGKTLVNGAENETH